MRGRAAVARAALAAAVCRLAQARRPGASAAAAWASSAASEPASIVAAPSGASGSGVESPHAARAPPRTDGDAPSAPPGATGRLPADVPGLRAFMRRGDVSPPLQSPPPSPSPSPPQPARATYSIETWGCAMNESDEEIVASVLAGAGYVRVHDADAADVLLLNTCAIREHAEAKVWQRLHAFRNLRRRRPRTEERPVVGVLGCMAERLKDKLLSDGLADVVMGPDTYRELPRLLNVVRSGEADTAMDVALSLDETYADIAPLRGTAAAATAAAATATGASLAAAQPPVSALVSISRGCNNMCSFCVVPFTRGRERSRPTPSIEAEVARLVAEGCREVTLLGQNVNSFHDAGTEAGAAYSSTAARYVAAAGFRNMYRLRDGDGVRFVELLDRLSSAHPEMRFRFTSPHPKDFPDDLLALMAERANVCKQVHMPAQSGSTRVLEAMRRGYTREAYTALRRASVRWYPALHCRRTSSPGSAARRRATTRRRCRCCARCGTSRRSCLRTRGASAHTRRTSCRTTWRRR